MLDYVFTVIKSFMFELAHSIAVSIFLCRSLSVLVDYRDNAYGPRVENSMLKPLGDTLMPFLSDLRILYKLDIVSSIHCVTLVALTRFAV